MTVQKKRRESADGKLDVIIHPTKKVAVGPGLKDFITDLSVIVHQSVRHNVYPKNVKDAVVQSALGSSLLRFLNGFLFASSSRELWFNIAAKKTILMSSFGENSKIFHASLVPFSFLCEDSKYYLLLFSYEINYLLYLFYFFLEK